MSTITADPNMLAVLRQVKEVTEIRDANGNVVGTFSPVGKTKEPLFDLEEAERISREQGHLGRPLQEIWKDIRAGRSVE